MQFDQRIGEHAIAAKPPNDGPSARTMISSSLPPTMKPPMRSSSPAPTRPRVEMLAAREPLYVSSV